MEVMNSTQTALPAAVHTIIPSAQIGLLGKALDGTSIFSVFVTLFAVAVVYDQGE